MTGSVIFTNRCHMVAPSTLAASCSSSGTSARPASSSSAMNGVFFQTSVTMIATYVPNVWLSGSPLRPSSFGIQPLFRDQAYCQLNADTTATIAYGTSATERSSPRATSVRCIASASSIPSTNWMLTAITVIAAVCSTSCHHTVADSTWP
jgi:hypothetical protein